MAQVTGSHSRYDLQTKGENVKDDLTNIITIISPTETPFQSNIGKGKAKNTFTDWLTDTLAAASASNAHIDGDAFSGDTLTAPARLQNHCQIMRKDIVVTRRAQIVDQAGTKSELQRQIAKAGKELKRDVEKIICSEQVAVVGNDTTASKLAGLGAWYDTNTDRGTSGTDGVLSSTTYGYPATAVTTGTDRALSEATLLSIVKGAYVEGGNPSIIMVGPTVKQKMSQYLFGSSARIATPYQDHGKSKSAASVIGAVDYYTSDFGTLHIIPNRFQSETDVHVIDPEFWELQYLDGYKTEKMAKTSDADQRMLTVDLTLCSKNEAASGLVGDVDSSTAMVA